MAEKKLWHCPKCKAEIKWICVEFGAVVGDEEYKTYHCPECHARVWAGRGRRGWKELTQMLESHNLGTVVSRMET